MTEREQREPDQSSICWFTTEMAAVVGSLGRSWELWTPFGSPMCVGGARMLCSFPRYFSRELHWMWSSWDLNWRSNVGCLHHRVWLNALYHNSGYFHLFFKKDTLHQNQRHGVARWTAGSLCYYKQSCTRAVLANWLRFTRGLSISACIGLKNRHTLNLKIFPKSPLSRMSQIVHA